MKRNYFTAILLSAFAVTAIISCDRSDDIATGKPSVTSTGTFSGQIDSLQSGTVDSIKVVGFQYDINNNKKTLEFGRCKIDGDKFSMQLLTPPANLLNHLNIQNQTEYSGYYKTIYTSDLIVSDTTIYAFGALQFETYKNRLSNGRISKSNNTKSSMTGYKYSGFLYSDKYCTIKGTEIFKREYNGEFKYTPYYSESKSNVSLSPGWNEIVISYDKVLKTDSTYYELSTASNVITTDLRWKWKSTSSNYAASKKGIKEIVQNHQMLFFRKLLK